MNQTDLFENIELETPSNTNTSVKDIVMDEARPSITSPEWNDYVLSLFEENEKYDGRPKCHGLRRVAELFLGEIVSSRPVQVFPPTDDAFCVFNTATAASRAEGRSLRKALRLSTIAAEEMTSKDTASITRSISQTKAVDNTQGEYEDSSRMTDNQANFIDVKCKQLNISGTKLFKEIFDVSTSRKIDKRQASSAIEKLNDYQQKSGTIPETIIGYNEDWRN